MRERVAAPSSRRRSAGMQRRALGACFLLVGYYCQATASSSSGPPGAVGGGGGGGAYRSYQRQQYPQHHHHPQTYHQQQQYTQQPHHEQQGQSYDAKPPQEQENTKREENEPQALPPGWTEHIDQASGRPYYYNAAEGVTTWTRPVVVVAESEDFVASEVSSESAAAQQGGAGVGVEKEEQQQQRLEEQPHPHELVGYEGQQNEVGMDIGKSEQGRDANPDDVGEALSQASSHGDGVIPPEEHVQQQQQLDDTCDTFIDDAAHGNNGGDAAPSAGGGAVQHDLLKTEVKQDDFSELPQPQQPQLQGQNDIPPETISQQYDPRFSLQQPPKSQQQHHQQARQPTREGLTEQLPPWGVRTPSGQHGKWDTGTQRGVETATTTKGDSQLGGGPSSPTQHPRQGKWGIGSGSGSGSGFRADGISGYAAMQQFPGSPQDRYQPPQGGQQGIYSQKQPQTSSGSGSYASSPPTEEQKQRKDPQILPRYPPPPGQQGQQQQQQTERPGVSDPSGQQPRLSQQEQRPAWPTQPTSRGLYEQPLQQYSAPVYRGQSGGGSNSSGGGGGVGGGGSYFNQYGQPQQYYGQPPSPPQQYGSMGQPGQGGGQPLSGTGGGGQLIQQHTDGIKGALGSAWQNVLGFGRRTSEVVGTARDSVVSSASVAGEQISQTSQGILSKARTGLQQVGKSLFEGDQQQGPPGDQPPSYSLSQYGVPPAPGRPGPQSGQPGPPNQQRPGQLGQPPYYGRGYHPMRGGPDRLGGQPEHSGISPRGSVPFPHQGDSPGGQQQRGPIQAQWGGPQAERPPVHRDDGNAGEATDFPLAGKQQKPQQPATPYAQYGGIGGHKPQPYPSPYSPQHQQQQYKQQYPPYPPQQQRQEQAPQYPPQQQQNNGRDTRQGDESHKQQLKPELDPWQHPGFTDGTF